jgi:hypothetical protein
MQLTMQEKIEIHMGRAGLNVGQLAEKMEWTREWMSAKINGRAEWKMSELKRAADILGVSLRDLLDDPIETVQ